MNEQKDIVKELVSIANKLDGMELYALADKADLILKQAMPPEEVSKVEREQFGKPHPTRSHPYISETDMDDLVETHISKLKKNKNYKMELDPDLVALTPGMMLAVINGPKVQEWFEFISNYDIPDRYKYIILVPCAASKPWGKDSCSGHYYPAYNNIKEEYRDEAFWITISEPLGIVPETHWDNFPAYDAPGIFRDPTMQVGGMHKKEWVKRYGDRFNPPWDEKAREKVMSILGGVIAEFVSRNQKDGRKWISFIDQHNTKGKLTTHREMVDIAKNQLEDWLETNYTKTKPDTRPHKDIAESFLSEKLKQEIP
jgi:hypothetical protein